MSALLSRDDLCWVPNAFLRLFTEIVSLALGARRLAGLEPRCGWMSKSVVLRFLSVGFQGVVWEQVGSLVMKGQQGKWRHDRKMACLLLGRWQIRGYSS